MFRTAIYLPFLLGMAQVPVAAKAQINKVKGDKQIVVNENKIRVGDLLDTLSRQTDLEFSFNSKKINPSKIITVTHHNQTLTAWLKELEQSTGIRFKAKGDHIILQDLPVTETNIAVLPAGVQESESSRKERLQGKQVQAKMAVLAAPKQTTESSLLAPTTDDTTVEIAYTDTSADGPFSQQAAFPNTFTETVAGKDLHLLFTHEPPPPGTAIRPVNNDSIFEARTAALKDSSPSAAGDASPLRPITKLDLGVQGIGISFERKMGQKFMIDLSLGLGGGYNVWDDKFKYKWNLLDPAVYFSVNPRFYYNRDRRSKKGRTTSLNAGEYVGMRLKFTTANLAGSDSLYATALINVHWGIQRPIGRKWLVNAHVGVGYAFDVSDFDTKDLDGSSFWDKVSPTLYPAVECKISYVLNRRRNL